MTRMQLSKWVKGQNSTKTESARGASRNPTLSRVPSQTHTCTHARHKPGIPLPVSTQTPRSARDARCSPHPPRARPLLRRRRTTLPPSAFPGPEGRLIPPPNPDPPPRALAPGLRVVGALRSNDRALKRATWRARASSRTKGGAQCRVQAPPTLLLLPGATDPPPRPGAANLPDWGL